LESGLEKTVRWYLDNMPWWRRTMNDTYDTGRLGLGRQKEEKAGT
jgi:dTDP-glucose 4,6-dehydratase